MIDVSAYQGRPDWRRVHASGHTLVYIKSGENYQMDSRFKYNIKAARKAGMSVGLYWYGHPSHSPQEEARYFLRTFQSALHKGDYPPALDLEVAEGYSYSYLNDWKAQWLAIVDDFVNCRAMFYSYYYFLKQMELWPDRPVWGAATGSNFTPPESWNIHQYSFVGSVPGIRGHVDLSRVLRKPKLIDSGV
jgi:lysozyme